MQSGVFFQPRFVLMSLAPFMFINFNSTCFFFNGAFKDLISLFKGVFSLVRFLYFCRGRKAHVCASRPCGTRSKSVNHCSLLQLLQQHSLLFQLHPPKQAVLAKAKVRNQVMDQLVFSCLIFRQDPSNRLTAYYSTIPLRFKVTLKREL